MGTERATGAPDWSDPELTPMKVATKLIVALVVGVCVVLAAFGWIRVQRETRLFDADVRRDHRAVAMTLASSVETVWRTSGEKEALALVRAADRSKAHIRIRWIWLEEGTAQALLDDGSFDRLQAGDLVQREVHIFEHDGRWTPDESADPWLVTAVPVHTASPRAGALELAESLAPAHAYLHTTLTNLILSLAAVIVVCTLIMLLSSVVLVGRPMGVLVERARSIGGGNLSDRLHLTQRDEIGELGREMDAMCERLEAARENLDKETAARIATLEQLRHADRLTTVGRLAAGIAHELGTPLNVVSGRAKMLARDTLTPEQSQEYARIVSEQAERMAGIIRQLLDFARRREPKRQRHDLRAVAAQTVSMLTPLARKRGVQITLEGEPLQVSLDAGQVQQALTNLIVNAVHASPEHATVEVEVTQGEATRPEGTPQQVAIVRVADHGGGIPPEVRDQIFEPFFTTKPVGEGTGLGLSVTRDIVAEHDGWITVDSAASSGTTFILHLPLSEES